MLGIAEHSSLTVFQREVWWHLPLLALGVSCFIVAFHLVFAVLRSRRDRKVEQIFGELYRDLWDARQLKQDDHLKFFLYAFLQAQTANHSQRLEGRIGRQE